jgi:hypothetical protein
MNAQNNYESRGEERYPKNKEDLNEIKVESKMNKYDTN